MTDLHDVLQRVAASNELMFYGILFLAFLTFLAIAITAVSFYAHHRTTTQVLAEMKRSTERSNYYLFKKLGPVDLP